MKKFAALIITLAFILSCAAFPPPALAKKTPEPAAPAVQSYKVGDSLRIQLGKDQFIAVVVVDIYIQSSAATGEISTFYRLKEEKYYTLPEGDPRMVPGSGPRAQ